MNESCCVEVVESEEELINYVLFMYFFESSFVDCVIEVSVHELEDEVNVAGWEGGENLVEFDDVWVVDLFEDGDLSESPLGVGAVLEGFKDLFKREEFGGFVWFGDLPNVAVGTRAEFLQYFVPFGNVVVYFFLAH